MKIEVVGPGCGRCKTTKKNVDEAVVQMGITAEVVYVTDIAQFAQKGVMMTPAVIVDGQIKISGKIPTVDEIKAVLSSNQ